MKALYGYQQRPGDCAAPVESRLQKRIGTFFRACQDSDPGKLTAAHNTCNGGHMLRQPSLVGDRTKRNRQTTANSNALKLSCELIRIFVTEAMQRSGMIAEAEGINKIEPTHLERVLPQLLLDF